MDRAELWNFVKDCQMTADRKRLPSVMVDLIFQRASMGGIMATAAVAAPAAPLRIRISLRKPTADAGEG